MLITPRPVPKLFRNEPRGDFQEQPYHDPVTVNWLFSPMIHMYSDCWPECRLANNERLMTVYTCCRCRLTGAGLEGLIVGQPQSLLLQIMDAFGNCCIAGGHSVSASLTGPSGSDAFEALVHDNLNGTFSIVLNVDRAGLWHLIAR